ncbi:MAG: HEAT repeat domain-containing protein, partial [Planctomycetota bacterium]|nr:HEAT repeat domain-containing protein [Planctomycetota bacterium]
EFRDGMVELVLSTPSALARARSDIAGVGQEMVPVIVRGLQDGGRPALERKALVDLGAAIPCARIAGALCDLAADAEEAWLRRYAVWALETHRSVDGADAVVPRLLLRMKYEPDGEALGWILRTLWGFGCSAALERARARAETLGDPAGRASLEASLAGYAGLEAPVVAAPSEALLGETWLWISDLSGAHFQLRGVDDARYVLSSLGPWAGDVFSEALEDDDDYVRLHIAQVLERMGLRGLSATSSLGAALEDPNGAVRGAAAEALVAVAGDGAASMLIARLDGSPAPPYEDRVALARALASLPTVPEARLRELFDSSQGVDLRIACAGGLLRAADGAALTWLLEQLRVPTGDPAGAEATVQRWLAGPVADVHGLLNPAAALEAWRAHEPTGAVIHSAAEAKDRRSARADALERLRAPATPPDGIGDR